MTKKDFKFIAILLVVSAILLGGYQWFISKRKDTKEYAFVYHNNNKILEFEIDQDDIFHLNGDYGKMTIEVNDGKYRVVDVECPNHDCERVGWVSKGSASAILCVPNDVFITQDAKN